MKKLLPIFSVVLFGSLLILSGCAKPVVPDYIATENLRVNKMGITESVVMADVKYFNPNNYKMKLKRADMDVYINNRLVGHSVLDSMIVIPRKDTFYLPVVMKVDLRQVFPNALDILVLNEAEVKLIGKARVGRNGFYFNVPIQYSGMQKLNLFK